MPRIRVSLANKCQILFGAAVVIILIAALSVPWFRMQKLVEEGQRETARKLVEAWRADMVQLGQWVPFDQTEATESLRFHVIAQDKIEAEAAADPFLAGAIEQAEAWANKREAFEAVRDDRDRWLYRFVRIIRQDDLESDAGASTNVPATQVANPIKAVLLIEMRADWAQQQIHVNRIYLAIAGLLAGLLAIAVFWYVLTRIVLSPVRILRDTAEQVAQGDLNIRSDLNTGDEFEQLSDMFNTMLANLKASQDKLRDLNKQLDLKLGELAQSNLSLYEANRIKGDFLANVSHELRTPLNSIIGFAEVLSESMSGDDAGSDKRRRYVEHILNSSRSLLQMITELLDLAKIEAGRVDLHVDRIAVGDLCERLVMLMRPQADRNGLTLALNLARDLPVVQTDPGKFQQIIFNFLSNAVKFTPSGGRVEIGSAATVTPGGQVTGVKVWVKDNGPGIPYEKHAAIFEKFRQLDSTHTREHGGTGLGLAISRELARLLEGRIELESDVGRGAIFTLIIPLTLEAKSEPLMPDLAL